MPGDDKGRRVGISRLFSSERLHWLFHSILKMWGGFPGGKRHEKWKNAGEIPEKTAGKTEKLAISSKKFRRNDPASRCYAGP